MKTRLKIIGFYMHGIPPVSRCHGYMFVLTEHKISHHNHQLNWNLASDFVVDCISPDHDCEVKHLANLFLQLLPRMNKRFASTRSCCFELLHHDAAWTRNLVTTKETRRSSGTSLKSRISSTKLTNRGVHHPSSHHETRKFPP